jgi:hypothetical protein
MNEPESNLEGFVVSDDEVEYDSDSVTNLSRSRRGNRSIAIEDSDIESIDSNSSPATIEISDGRSFFFFFFVNKGIACINVEYIFRGQ